MMQEWFSKFAKKSSSAIGSPWCFTVTFAAMVGWLALGPYMGYSDSWQLWANTTTTLMTTLVVVLIQNTQDRDTTAIQLKLDELIRASERADNRMVGIEKKD